MRRIYESDAVKRDDTQFTPQHRKQKEFKPKAFRWIPSSSIARSLLPSSLVQRGISVSVSSPRREYFQGSPIPFTVTLKNSFPFQVRITTSSPILWNWYVNGHEEASMVPVRTAPQEAGTLTFERGERKTFQKRWNGRFRTASREWTKAEHGEYTIAVGINVEEPKSVGLWAETSVRIVPE